jgi:hypothetical protein
MGILNVRIPIAPESELNPLAARIALGALLIGAQRLFLQKARGGIPITLLIVLSSLVACGYTRIGPAYVVIVSLFLAAALYSLRRSTQPGPKFFALDWQRKSASLFMLLVGITTAAILSFSIPVLQRKVAGAFIRMQLGSTSGVTDSILLGGSADINESDEVVLRIQGGNADYLRGFVFSDYRNEAWTVASDNQSSTVQTIRPEQAPQNAIEIRSAKTQPRFYLPLEARAVATPSGQAMVDRMGTFHALSGISADAVSFLPLPRDKWLVAPPIPADTVIPQPMRPRLASLLAQWTAPDVYHARLGVDVFECLEFKS